MQTTRDAILQRLREAKQDLAREYPIRRMALFGSWARGMTHEEILDDYPELTEDDIRACLAYAADREGKARVIV